MLSLRSLSRPGYTQAALVKRGYLRAHPARFHSLEDGQPLPRSSAEDTILAAALSHVPIHGFTVQALRLGAQDAGYLPVSTNLFPRAAFDLVNHHLVTQRRALVNHFERPEISSETNEPPKDIHDRVRLIAAHRLLANAPYISHYQSALALLASPTNISVGLQELARLADEVLYLAGSTTVTTAWYTDRAGLASIYAAAELFMTQDKSADFTDTKDFLASRLNEGNVMRRAGGMFGQWIGMQFGGAIDGLRSKGVWI